MLQLFLSEGVSYKMLNLKFKNLISMHGYVWALTLYSNT